MAQRLGSNKKTLRSLRLSRTGRRDGVANRHAYRKLYFRKQSRVAKPVRRNRGTRFAAGFRVDKNTDVVCVAGIGSGRLSNLPPIFYSVENRPQESPFIRRWAGHGRGPLLSL